VTRIGQVNDPVAVSYLTAMLGAEGIRLVSHDLSPLNIPTLPDVRFHLFVDEADAPAARALLRRLEAADGAKYGVEEA
jgi:hypothetical protein